VSLWLSLSSGFQFLLEPSGFFVVGGWVVLTGPSGPTSVGLGFE
jgi:hypothetical protein